MGTLDVGSLAIEPAPDGPGAPPRGAPPWRRPTPCRASCPEPEAGLAAGILIGLRDLVDRDLAAAFTTAGVSHVVAISGWNIAIVAAAIAAMTGRLGRRRRSVVTLARDRASTSRSPARRASVVRAALMAGVVLLARESGSGGPRRRRARLGAPRPARLGPGAHRRCRVPAVVAGDGRADRLGDAAHRVARAARRRAPPALAGREPRRLAGRPGGDAADRPRLVRPAGGPVARSSTCSSSRSSRRRWRPASSPWLAASLVVAGAPPVIGAVLAAPGWVDPRACSSPSSRRPRASRSRASRSGHRSTSSAAVAAALGLGALDVVATTACRTTRRTDRCVGPRRPREPGHDAAATSARHAGPRAAAPRRGRIAGGAASSPSSSRSPSPAGSSSPRPAGIARVSILDVGQGDAILVEGSRGGRLLIDGGPDPDRLLVALDARIPPWDRRIDARHPDPPARGPRRRAGAAPRALPASAGSSSRG